MENFVIRAYGRTELAQCYFPSLSPQSAYRKLQSWIDYHPTLRDRLESGIHEHLSPQPGVYAGAGADDRGGDRGTLGNEELKMKNEK